MFKRLASFFLAASLTLGTTARAGEISAEKQENPCSENSENENILEQKVNSWFAPQKKKQSPAPPSPSPFPSRQFSAVFNPYRYNFHRFSFLYPFATSGVFPQQYVAGGTLIDLPVSTDFFSDIFRLQIQGTSDYLTTREFSSLITPQAEVTFAFFNPEAQRNLLRYTIRDAQEISQRAKILELSRFYSNTPSLMLKFRAEGPSSSLSSSSSSSSSSSLSSSSYQAQAVISYADWFLGGKYLLSEDISGATFLFGKDNFYAAVAQFPEIQSIFFSLTGQWEKLQYSLEGENTPEGWKVSFNILGSSIEAELFGK